MSANILRSKGRPQKSLLFSGHGSSMNLFVLYSLTHFLGLPYVIIQNNALYRKNLWYISLCLMRLTSLWGRLWFTKYKFSSFFGSHSLVISLLSVRPTVVLAQVPCTVLHSVLFSTSPIFPLFLYFYPLLYKILEGQHILCPPNAPLHELIQCLISQSSWTIAIGGAISLQN